jgi:hypothetical protein
MQQVKAVQVKKPETGGKRRRHGRPAVRESKNLAFEGGDLILLRSNEF